MNLLSFINEAKNPFYAVKTVKEILNENGYTELFENETYNIKKGGKYYVARNGSSLIAFEIPKCNPVGFMLGASHTDSPTFKIKMNGSTFSSGYAKLNTEKYGGGILHTWFDRPLCVSGRVTVSKDGVITPLLFDSKDPIAIIPSVAIHMDRSVNEKFGVNPAVDTVPIFGLDEKQGILKLVAKKLKIKENDIIDTDLFLYSNGGVEWGEKKEFVSSPRLDDLQCLYGLLCGLVASTDSKAIKVLYCADNEEVGSGTRQGAGSYFLADTLRRVCGALNLGADGYERLVANGFMVSADNAHAVHPNHPEYSDKDNCPKINGGIVIKYNSNQKYCTDGISGAIFRQICKKADVPTQVFANRSDMPGGSTLGNISAQKVCMSGVDIGLPQLAMHSAYETAGTKDTKYLISAMTECYSSYIEFNGDTVSVKKGE